MASGSATSAATRRWSAAPSARKLNADVTLPLTVVGIMPPGFDYPRGADVFVPAAPLLRTFAPKASGPAREHAQVAEGLLRRRTPEAGRRRGSRDSGADPGLAQPRPRGRPRGAALDRAAADPRLPAGAGRARAADAARRRAPHAAHRLRERRRSAGVPRVAAPARPGDPRRARRVAPPAGRTGPRSTAPCSPRCRSRPRSRWRGACCACSCGWRPATCRGSATWRCSTSACSRFGAAATFATAVALRAVADPGRAPRRRAERARARRERRLRSARPARPARGGRRPGRHRRRAAVRHGALPPHRPRAGRAPCSASIPSSSLVLLGAAPTPRTSNAGTRSWIA